ncbi:hypothetical protein CEXT_610311 [Caerostris extrusa]|uniref:Uncharacterized protein n=1 Tax=Caerostris extrusa TaxID=172846 RepID=A0AAV4S6F7_CAEEX|nr:hypothetical protein CEXT_610311 [Caerostris extrusa]
MLNQASGFLCIDPIQTLASSGLGVDSAISRKPSVINQAVCNRPRSDSLAGDEDTTSLCFWPDDGFSIALLSPDNNAESGFGVSCIDPIQTTASSGLGVDSAISGSAPWSGQIC